MKSVFQGFVCLYLLLLFNCEQDDNKYCKIYLPYLPDDYPVLTWPRTTKLVYPNKPHSVVIEKGTSVELHCPGTKLIAEGCVLHLENPSIATCVFGFQFEINGITFDMQEFRCEKRAVSIVVNTGKQCHQRGTTLSVGYKLDLFRFLLLYEVCYNFTERVPLVTHHVINHWADWSKYMPSGVYVTKDLNTDPIDLEKIYEIENQRRTINGQLDLPDDRTAIISENLHLKPFKLVSSYDFVHRFEIEATLHFINIAPQWSNLFNKNWVHIEKITRKYSVLSRVDLEVYTGTLGILRFYNSDTLNFQKVFLYYENDNKAVPIPFLFWKLVYDRENKKGIVFIALNNPYYREDNKTLICPNVSDKLEQKWSVRVNMRANKRFGYIFVCNIDDFRSKVGLVPHMEVNSLLFSAED